MKKVEINGITLSDDAIETIRCLQNEDNAMATELIHLLDDYIALRAWIGLNETEGTAVNSGPKSTLLNIHSATVFKDIISKLKA